jgi:hypothetical protein
MLDRSSIIMFVVCSGVGTLVLPKILPDRLFAFSTRAPSNQLAAALGTLFGFSSLALLLSPTLRIDYIHILCIVSPTLLLSCWY